MGLLESKLRIALDQFLAERSLTLSKNPLDNLSIPLGDGNTLLVPVSFLENDEDVQDG